MDWLPRVLGAQMLFSNSTPQDGYFPPLGNGFISGDVGCLMQPTASPKGSCGMLHMGGVFNTQTGAIPNRAVIPNPFAVSVVVGGEGSWLGGALDLEWGVFFNRSRVVCDRSCGEATTFATIEVSQYAHQQYRQMLVLNITALDLPSNPQCTCTVNLTSCTVPTTDFHTAAVPSNNTGILAANLTVVAMEIPPTNGSVPTPPPTVVGVAYQPVSQNVVLSHSQPSRVFLAAFRTTLLDDVAVGENPAAVATGDVVAFSAEDEQQQLLESHIVAMRENVWPGGIELSFSPSLDSSNGTLIASTVNSSLFYIYTSARADWPFGTSPGGLARNDYNGHSFWDTETWMLPPVALLSPDLATSFLRYRHSRIPAAQDRARAEGHKGAKWPWESALLGYGVSRWTVGDEYEIHITGDIPLAARLLGRLTRNDSWLSSEVWDMVSVSADYFVSRAVAINTTTPMTTTPTTAKSAKVTSSSVRNEDTHTAIQPEIVAATTVTTTNYTFKSVIPADESAGVQNDSVFTNAVAALTCEYALWLASRFSKPTNPQWQALATSPYLPVQPLPNDPNKSIGHLEYTGYHGQDINQADVALLQYPLSMAMPDSIAIADLTYYEPRTSTGKTEGFFTGDSAYAIAWSRLGEHTAANAQFANAFLHMDTEHYNVWMERDAVHGGGNLNFLTGAGGYLQNWIFGLAGAVVEEAGIQFSHMSLPPGGTVSGVKLRGLVLAGMRANLEYNGDTVQVERTNSEHSLSEFDVLCVRDAQGIVHTVGTMQEESGAVVLPLQDVFLFPSSGTC